MTSREKRWYAEQGIGWRDVEAAKRKPVEVAPFVETCNRMSRALPVAFEMALPLILPNAEFSPKPWRRE